MRRLPGTNCLPAIQQHDLIYRLCGEWQWFRVPSTQQMKIMACVSITEFHIIHFEMLVLGL